MKKRIGIIFGGRSGEHEISVLSAASVLAAIDREKYDPVPLAIDKSGQWFLPKTDLRGLETLGDSRLASLFDGADSLTLTDFDKITDFAFPLLHGSFGEDGTIQGLFEMLGKPYAGCGVTASAISMDKIFTKEIWKCAGLPIGKYIFTTKAVCADAGIPKEIQRIERELKYPIFVKPANLGSSIGITKVSCPEELKTAIEIALEYDRRIICEEAIAGRELEVALLGNDMPIASVPGEVLTDAVYYDYDSKYRGGAEIAVPADVSDTVRREIEAAALAAYLAVDGAGFARVDMFYDENAGRVYLNEMNAIPGFTRYSMFPLLFKASGIEYTELIERIIELGYERHNAAHRR